jgi:hypothetical protein
MGTNTWKLSLVGILCAQACAETSKSCTAPQQSAASQAADTIDTWDDVYRSYKEFLPCDDGSISEEYSDKIVGVLTRRWSSVARLAQLVKVDPAFEKFVLNHVDTLMTPEQAQAVIANATAHCPSRAKGVCAAIERKARHPDS